METYEEANEHVPLDPLPSILFRFSVYFQGCLEIKIELCEEFPPDWAQTFLQYKSVEIQATWPGAMPSFGPFIKARYPCRYKNGRLQLLLTDPCPTLEYFQFSVHHKERFISQVEIFELGLKRWKIRRRADKGQVSRIRRGVLYVF